MEKKRKTKIGKWAQRIVLALVALLLVCAAVYFLLFPKITLVSDSTFQQVYKSSEIWKLRLDYAGSGKRLSVLKLDDSAFDSEEQFRSALGKAKGKTVVLSPIVSAYAIWSGIDVSSLLEKSLVFGISMNTESECFDCTLVPDEKSGWVEAAAIIAEETSNMSQNVALIYESDTISYIEDIVSCFPGGHVSKFERIPGSSLFPSNTKTAMDEQGIVLALCPYVVSLNRFFSTETTVMWIVDYRFASVVPEDNLYGVVMPDLTQIPEIMGYVYKDRRGIDYLTYIYVKK